MSVWFMNDFAIHSVIHTVIQFEYHKVTKIVHKFWISENRPIRLRWCSADTN